MFNLLSCCVLQVHPPMHNAASLCQHSVLACVLNSLGCVWRSLGDSQLQH